MSQAKTTLQRLGYSLQRVVEAPSIHPAISAVTWDVFLTVASLSVWVAIRGIDLRTLGKNSFAPWLRLPKTDEEASDNKRASSAPAKRTRRPSASATSTANDTKTGTQRRKASTHGRKPSRGTTRTSPPEDENLTTNVSSANILDSAPTPAAATRRSTRAKHSKTPSITASSFADDPKNTQEPDEEVQDDVDDSFVPTPSTRRDVAKMIPAPEHGSVGGHGAGEEWEESGETIAVGWGLFIIGGLGAMASGVLGADW